MVLFVSLDPVTVTPYNDFLFSQGPVIVTPYNGFFSLAPVTVTPNIFSFCKPCNTLQAAKTVLTEEHMEKYASTPDPKPSSLNPQPQPPNSEP